MNKAGADAILPLLQTPELPELGPGPRKGIRSEAELRSELVKMIPDVPQPQLVTALVLLWHDHLDAAHCLAQDTPGTDGAFVHGIMHRREPDYGNAGYWFRRVGRHATFSEIAAAVQNLLDSCDNATLKAKLVPGGEWDPLAFIDACAEAARTPGSVRRTEPILRQIQRIETELLIRHLLAHSRAGKPI